LGVREVGISGEKTTPGAPRDDSDIVGADCTGVSDDASTLVGDNGSGISRAAWTEVSDDGATAIGEDPEVSTGAPPPGEAKKTYVSAAKPNAAIIAVPAISFRWNPNVSERVLGSGGRTKVTDTRSPPRHREIWLRYVLA
jgi:hypothetical protein